MAICVSWASWTGCDDRPPALSGQSWDLTPSATAAKPGEALSPAGRQVALPPLPALPGDRLVYRFVDHAGEAQLELSAPHGAARPAGLVERLSALDSPYKLISPYSGLRSEPALRVIEVALVDGAVEKYPRTAPLPGSDSSGASTGAGSPRFDPVWNRYRGVYESKVSLFAPAPSCYRFRMALPKRGLITLHAAAIPPLQKPVEGADVEFTVALDGKPLWQTRASRKDGTLGRWLPAEIPLPPGSGAARHELSLCTAPQGGGTPAGSAVWGSPELWAEEDGAAAPNLLLILVDTLRADALPVMPRLSGYARESVSFTQAISQATWTRPSLLGILGGDLPTAVGQSAEEMIPSERDRKRFYALDRRLLPRLLRDAGYKVASIGNNFFLLGYPQIGLSLGFDEVADVRHPVEDSPAITRAALAFLHKYRRRSFFLQLHYDAPHWPYAPPPEWLRGIPDALAAELAGAAPGKPIDSQARAYLGEAAYADAQIAAVLDELKRLELAERTLVVVLGDHGEVFDPQHNHFVQALRQPTLYHHGWSAYDEVLRVPLIFGMPGRLPAGVEVPSQVRLIDVAPTVLELLGLGAWRSLLPSGARGAGQSLLPLVLSGGLHEDRPAFVEGQNIRALRDGGYLYLRRGDPRLQRAQGNDGAGPIYRISEELYDLRRDPRQHHDLLAALRETKADGAAGAASAAGEKAPPRALDPAARQAIVKALAEMRDAFARHAPIQPEQGLPVTHLQLAPDAQAQHLLTGTLLSSDPALSVQGVRSGEVVPRGPGRIDVTLRPGGALDVLVDPAARLELTLYRDGLPLGSRDLLLGPFSLPLLSDAAALVVDGVLLDRLSAAYPPVLGERGEVLLWRDQAAPGMAATQAVRTSASASEVATMMRDWGYARPDTPAPARPADGGVDAKTSTTP